MPAIVRVKRRIDEEPLSAFVLNGKKRRFNEGAAADELGAAGDKDEISTILKFAGTINEQDNKATTRLARLTKETAKEMVQHKQTRRSGTNHTERARQEMRQSLHEQRFRVVNCLRTTLDAQAITEDDEKTNKETAVDDAAELNANQAKQITILDIEKQCASDAPTTGFDASSSTTATTIPDLIPPTDSDTGYVYDLYLPENEQQAAYVDLMDDNYLSVRAFDNFTYDERYNNYDDDEHDSEDSNQENYYTNEYPDEDDDQEFQTDNSDSDGTQDIRRAVEKFIFDDDDEDNEAADALSSDDEDVNRYQDPYMHTLDTEGAAFADDIDYCDADRYGVAYARYKARILKRLKPDPVDDDYKDADDMSDSSNERYHSASENDDKND